MHTYVTKCNWSRLNLNSNQLHNYSIISLSNIKHVAPLKAIGLLDTALYCRISSQKVPQIITHQQTTHIQHSSHSLIVQLNLPHHPRPPLQANHAHHQKPQPTNTRPMDQSHLKDQLSRHYQKLSFINEPKRVINCIK